MLGEGFDGVVGGYLLYGLAGGLLVGELLVVVGVHVIGFGDGGLYLKS